MLVAPHTRIEAALVRTGCSRPFRISQPIPKQSLKTAEADTPGICCPYPRRWAKHTMAAILVPIAMRHVQRRRAFADLGTRRDELHSIHSG
jgi:hypothetical protein